MERTRDEPRTGDARVGGGRTGDDSMSGGASVDEERLTGDERGAGRREEDDRGSDILRRSEASERRAPDLLLAERRIRSESLARHVGLDRARSDGVDSDAVRRELERERSRDVDDATLRGAVRDALTPAHHAVHRGDVHYASAVLRGDH